MENATTLQTSNGMEWTVGSGLWVSNVDLERELDGVHGINLDLVSLALGIPTRSGRSGWMTSWFDLVSWTPPPPTDTEPCWDNYNGTVTVIGDAAHPMTFRKFNMDLGDSFC